MLKYTLPLIALVYASPVLAEPIDDDARVGDAIIVTASRSGEGTRVDQLGSSVTVISDQELQQRQNSRESHRWSGWNGKG